MLIFKANLPSGKTVTETFDPWIRQMGFPLLKVNEINGFINVTQTRFLDNPEQNPEEPESSFKYQVFFNEMTKSISFCEIKRKFPEASKFWIVYP